MIDRLDLRSHHLEIFGHDFDADAVAAHGLGDYERGAGTCKRVEHGIAFFGEKFDKPLWQFSWECSAVIFVAALGGEVKHISWVNQFSTYPIGDVFAKTAAVFGVVAPPVSCAQIAQTTLAQSPTGTRTSS